MDGYNLSQKMDGLSQMMKTQSPIVDGYNLSPKMDRSSQEDENSKPKSEHVSARSPQYGQSLSKY